MEERLHLLKFDYSDMRIDILRMYYGYFNTDSGNKLDIRTLSDQDISDLMDDDVTYYVPLIVKNVTEFKENDKVVYTNLYDEEYILVCDDPKFLSELNDNVNNHLLIVVDEENPSTLDNLMLLQNS